MKKILTSSILVLVALFFSFFLPKTTFAATDCSPAAFGLHDQKAEGNTHVYGEVWLDTTKHLAYGYAFDNQDPNTKITVDFYNGPYCGNTNNFIPGGETTANLASDSKLTNGSTNHGFSFTLPPSVTSGSLYVYARNPNNTSYQVLIWQDATVLNFKLASAAPPAPPAHPPVLNGGDPPVATKHTLLNVSLQLPGIGQGGNLKPGHQVRPLHVTIYPANTDLVANPSTPATFDSDKSPTPQSITFNSTTGFFAYDSFDVSTLPTGDYKVFLKTPGYLRKEVMNTTDQTATIHITGATTNLMPLTKLIAGDVAVGDKGLSDVEGLSNVIGPADFYQIVGCYKDKATTSTCINKDLADINDDGTVDGIDINYWLLGYQAAQASQTQSSVEVQGDGVRGE